MAFLHLVAADAATIPVTHDACSGRKQNLPDLMLVNPQAAGRLVGAAAVSAQPRRLLRRRVQCSLAGFAPKSGLTVRLVDAGGGNLAHARISWSGLLAWAPRPVPDVDSKSGVNMAVVPAGGTTAASPSMTKDTHQDGAQCKALSNACKVCVNSMSMGRDGSVTCKDL
jgi:hypothetical protein